MMASQVHCIPIDIYIGIPNGLPHQVEVLVLGCYLGANYMPPKGKYCVCLLLIKFNSSNSEIKLK